MGPRLRRQWRPVIMPALVLWALATVVACTALRPFDVTEYERYAHAALHAPLLHHLPLEYPAPALVVFLLPLLLPLSYPWAFALCAGVVLLFLVASYDGSSLPGADLDGARRLIMYLALGAVMVLTGRYDIFATAAAFWSLRAARGDRWSAAWTWSCVGFLLKLFPAILWPALVIAEWRRKGRPPVRRLAWVAASLVLIAGVPATLDHAGALNALHYYLRRPSEIGSLAAGLSLLVDWHATTWVNSFHSVNVVNPVTVPLSMVLEVLAGLGCLWTWWLQARGRLRIEVACLLTMSLVVLGGKVLSAQYLMWLMPLWALYRVRVAWLLAALANLAVFPYAATAQSLGYVPTHVFAVTLTLSFLSRDLLMAWGTWMWLRSVSDEQPVSAWRHGRPPPASVPGRPGGLPVPPVHDAAGGPVRN
jgi:hypothetical protein